MRKITVIVTLALCFVFSGEAYAQRCLPKMRGIQITGGMVDGFHTKSSHNTLGYSFGFGVATYAKNANKWVFGVEVLNKYKAYREIRVPNTAFTAEGGYYYNVLSDASKTFFLSLGGSILAGYETVNWSEKKLYDGSTLQNSDHFVGGAAVTLEVESYLSDRIVLLAFLRERSLWGSSAGLFHTQFGVGLKFIIN